MNLSTSKSWVTAAVLFGVFYGLVGVLFALPASHMIEWRYAAWIVSGIAFLTHILYQRIRLNEKARSIAVHVAIGAALGAFLLAVAAVAHSIYMHTGNLKLLVIALVAWPMLIAIPAFLVAYIIIIIFDRLRHKS